MNTDLALKSTIFTVNPTTYNPPRFEKTGTALFILLYYIYTTTLLSFFMPPRLKNSLFNAKIDLGYLLRLKNFPQPEKKAHNLLKLHKPGAYHD